MQIDFTHINDDKNYTSVPEGFYLVSIAEVRTGMARDGSQRWNLRLDVLEGEFAGRVACFDNLTWSERGLLRVKLVLGALGFDVSGTLNLEIEDLLHRQAKVEVVRESYEAGDGTVQVRNTIPFRGWRPLEASVPSAQPPAAAPFEPGPAEAPF